jgi:hypothetical protein
VLVLVTSCGGGSSPTTPTPTPPARTTFNLTGNVANARLTTIRIPNATLTIQGGANDGKTTASDSAGNYTLSSLTPSTFTVVSHAAGYIDGSQSVTVGNGDTSVQILMDPPLFIQSGVGDNVFALPAFVSKVRVDATYPGSCQNFVVKGTVSGLLINIIIGTCSIADTRSPFSGTYLVKGGETLQTTISTGVSWTVTEQR